MKCRKGYTIEPMPSAAGFYLGTKDKEGYPNCCLTTTYAKTYEDAKDLLIDREFADENAFCNRYQGCFSANCNKCVLEEVTAFDETPF